MANAWESSTSSPSSVSANGNRAEVIDELIAYVREQFPAQIGEGDVGVITGGRKAAEIALQEVDPASYGKTRNFLSGAVMYSEFSYLFCCDRA